ncbi:hypothetical protein JMJ77_0007526, partial [Colletotrichum scovillei]
MYLVLRLSLTHLTPPSFSRLFSLPPGLPIPTDALSPLASPTEYGMKGMEAKECVSELRWTGDGRWAAQHARRVRLLAFLPLSLRPPLQGSGTISFCRRGRAEGTSSVESYSQQKNK